MEKNPFYLLPDIPLQYFCDRAKETDTMVRHLTNGNNMVLISPRKMGKSGLIYHVFQQKEIRTNFKTIYVDIYQTSSFKEFVFIFAKAIYDKLVPKSIAWIKKFLQTIRSLNGKFTVDPVTGYPSFSVMLGELENPTLTLEEIFRFISDYEKPCLIAIDEFQQITKYPEKNVEAILRTHIQWMSNTRFIFSGSERHVMQQIFFSYSRPFYQQASPLDLPAIPKELYVDFVKDIFKRNGKKIDVTSVEQLYDLFHGITFYMQKTLNESFSIINEEEICDHKIFNKALERILEINSSVYRGLLSNIPERQKELLVALAIADETEKITAADFIKDYSLMSASSVQSAARILLEKDYIMKWDGKYSVADKFMGLWIKKIYGSSSSTFLK